MLFLLISPALCQNTNTTTGCIPFGNTTVPPYQDFAALNSDSPVAWTPGSNFTAYITDTDNVGNDIPTGLDWFAAGAVCPNVEISAWQWQSGSDPGSGQFVAATSIQVSHIQYLPRTDTNPTEIQFNVNINGDAPNGLVEFKIGDYYGGDALTEYIQPLPPPPPPRPPLPHCPAQAILSVTPNIWYAGKTYDVTVTGTNFVIPYGTSVDPLGNDCSGLDISPYMVIYNPDFSAAGAFVESLTLNIVSATTATTTVSIPKGTSTQSVYFDISRLCDPDLDYSCPDGMPNDLPIYLAQIIGCPQPTITSITPNTWFAGKNYKTIITGTDFVTTEKATANCPVTPITITAADGSTVPVSVAVDSKTKITATVSPNADTATEAATVIAGTAPNTSSPPTPAQILGNQISCDPSMNCTQSVISTTDGSTPPTQTVVVGQIISLITNPNLPANIKPTNPTWTLTDGMNIGGYTVVKPAPYPSKSTVSSAKVKETEPNKSSLKTYWLYPNSSVPVTYHYCVDIPGADPVHQCSLEAKANFNVTGPTAEITAYQGDSPYMTWGWSVSAGYPGCTRNPKELTQFLAFGLIDTQAATCVVSYLYAGIHFEATNVNLDNVNAPNGVFQWVQLLTDGETFGTLKSGGAVPTYQLPTGLDNIYPYTTKAPSPYLWASDAPATGLVNTWANETKTFTAKMYLAWNPMLDPDSIAVPIGYLTWSINGSADNTKASPPWILGPGSINSQATTSYTASNAQQPSYGMPVWSKVSRNTAKTTSESESVQMDGEEEIQQ
jgi:hypothetical protein